MDVNANGLKLCQYHGSAAGCRYGGACFLSHSNPNSVQLCKRYISSTGCLYGRDCWDRHWDFVNQRDPGPARKKCNYYRYQYNPYRPASHRGKPRRMRRPKKRKKKAFKKMDEALAVYYAECHREDYYDDDDDDEGQKGKFMRFVLKQEMDEEAVELQLADGVNPNECPYVAMDPSFPFPAETAFPDFSSRNAAILGVLRRCYRFGKYGVLQRYKGIEWDLFCGSDSNCTFSGQSAKGGCSHLMRMVNALIYYSKFEIVGNGSSKRQLMEFANGSYCALLSDYIHTMDRHIESKHIDYIQERHSAKFGLIDKCDINNCLLLFRSQDRYTPDGHHHDDHDDDNDHKEEDLSGNSLFFRDIMDAMHCYLVHSYDIGLRIKVRRYPYDGNDGADSRWRTWETDKMYKYVCQLELAEIDVFVFCTSWCVARSH